MLHTATHRNTYYKGEQIQTPKKTVFERERERERERDRDREREREREKEREGGGGRGARTDTQTDRNTDRQTDRHRQREREAETETEGNPHQRDWDIGAPQPKESEYSNKVFSALIGSSVVDGCSLGSGGQR